MAHEKHSRQYADGGEPITAKRTSQNEMSASVIYDFVGSDCISTHAGLNPLVSEVLKEGTFAHTFPVKGTIPICSISKANLLVNADATPFLL